MKVAVIGGGSTYTPELVNGFLARHSQFPLSELWLMDIDPNRLEIVGGFAKRIVEHNGNPFKVILTTDQRSAVKDASYVITQLRAGQMEARKRDEYLGLRHGLIGQETTGIGGMAKAMRTIPIVLKLAQDIRELSQPGALLVNFTNPSGIITEALQRYAPDVPSVGVCNAPFNAKIGIINLLEKKIGTQILESQAELITLGLNHLSWHRGFRIDGEDVWSQVMEAYLDELRADPTPEWNLDLIRNLQMLPNYYLQYFYNTPHKLDEQKKWPPSRAESVIEIEKDLLKQYADPNLFEPPAELMKRGGAYYSTVATQLLNAHFNDLKENHVVNTRNNGAVKDWPSEWVLEIPSIVSRSGIVPLAADPLPPVCFGLLAQVKSYELLTVEAAVRGDRSAAFQALVANPLGPLPENAQAVLDDMLSTHKEHLPQFWK